MSRIGVVQMTSSASVEDNLEQAHQLIAQAAAVGAELVALPENFGLLAMHERDKLTHQEEAGDGPMQTMLAETAREHGVWLVGGTIPVRSDNPERPTQTCFVYDELGTQLARYDKVHLFDVEIAASGERYQESAYTTPGTRAVVVDSPFGRLGLSVCYDLRFPELYRLLVDQGAQILFAPAAFTQATGAAHWELLCRARAVENLAWMVAPAQVGTHENGRETWGHSMLVDPWGKVHGELANGTGIAWADIDLAKVAQTRLQFPAIANRRINCEFG